MTVEVFGYLVLICAVLDDFISRFLLSFSFDWEDISNTLESVCPHLEFDQKYGATRRIFFLQGSYLFQKQIARTFPGLRLIFPGL